MRLHLLHPKFIRDLEGDAHVQASFHQRMSYFWLLCMGLVLVIPTFHHDLAALLIMEVSLYANFSTEFGALASSQASEKAAFPGTSVPPSPTSHNVETEIG